MRDAHFDENSTAQDVLSDVDLHGRRFLVTGVSAGLGVETARALVARGAAVVGAARDLDKARSATAAVDDAARLSGGRFTLVACDLASLGSVRACSDELMRQNESFDGLIANAGVMATPFGRTANGFETQFGVNHLGHFVLVNRIASLLRTDGRLVVLSSAGHRFSDVDLDDPNFERTAYDPWQAYGRSKTANILFAAAFDARHRSRGARAVAVHPGAIADTELSRHIGATAIAAMARTFDEQLKAAGKPGFRFKTIPQGAATTVWAAVVAPAQQVGGNYCEDCHVAEPSSDPKVRGGVQPYALDPVRADALWRRSEELVGEAFGR